MFSDPGFCNKRLVISIHMLFSFTGFLNNSNNSRYSPTVGTINANTRQPDQFSTLQQNTLATINKIVKSQFEIYANHTIGSFSDSYNSSVKIE